jgi:hypothetical protein
MHAAVRTPRLLFYSMYVNLSILSAQYLYSSYVGRGEDSNGTPVVPVVPGTYRLDHPEFYMHLEGRAGLTGGLTQRDSMESIRCVYIFNFLDVDRF